MEMENLSARSKAKRTVEKDTASRTGDGMSEYGKESMPVASGDNTIAIWAYVKATWLVLLSLPLLAFPRFLLFLSSTSGREHRDTLTPLEGFLATHFGILLLSTAVGVLVSIPPDSPVEPLQKNSPPHPLLLPITCGSLLTAFLSYNTPPSQVGSLAFFVALGAGATGIWGVWALLFAGSSLVSHKTGADKRTSRLLFGNRSAASVQKKLWEREREAGQ